MRERRGCPPAAATRCGLLRRVVRKTVLASNKRDEGPARWSLRLFAGFELSVLPGGERVTSLGKRERVLLAYLALSPKGSQPRRKLATLLWGDATDETALDNLRTSIFNLRKALGDAEHRVIGSEGKDKDVVLDAASFEVDALTFRRRAAQSGRAELEEAANLYSGEFLDGLGIESEEFESWRREEACRFKDQAVDVLSRLMTQLFQDGKSEDAIEAGQRILRFDPLHEAAVRRLMRLYGESGRRGAAVQLYRTLSDALRTELNAQPEPATRAIFAELSRGGEGVAAPVAGRRLKRESRILRSGVSREAASGRDHATEREFPSLPPPRPVFRLRVSMAILAGAFIVAAVLVSYRQFAFPDTPQAAVAERTAAADPASAIAIAVLPFLNLSGNAGQEFFSDGMTEEITSALAMVPDLKVVARTSAFQFKGEKNDLRSVGKALNATHLIEGSVRKEGDHVRIVAQLIDAANGTHLWSENYDRQLGDIFTTQEEIARTIVGSLMAPLGLAPGDTLVHGTQNLGTYQEYLQAKAWYRDRNSPRSGPFLQTLESVVSRDPGFAPAWAVLARAYDGPAVPEGAPIETARRGVQTFQDKAEKAAQKAIQLDPRHPAGYAAMAAIRWHGGQWAAAEDLVKQGLALDPNDPDVLGNYWNILLKTGRPKEALAIVEKLQTLEPLVAAYTTNVAMTLQVIGQNEAAIAVFEAIPANGRSTVGDYYLARAYAAAGRYAESADTLLHVASGHPDPAKRKGLQAAASILRSAPAKAADPRALPNFGPLEGDLIFVYASVGAFDRALDYPEREAQIRMMPDFGKTIWSPAMAPARKTERFKKLARASGLLDYWRARGWPKFCHPTTGDDFACV
jgi:adenylate cyclase